MTAPSGKTTIYDIARLAGASPSTVSAVLNGTWVRRRIGETTVELIRKIASEQGYSINMQARGLRQARSGLVGMIIPIHDNRFFSSLSQNFDTLARERGLCPVIASTLRSPQEERRVVETLISYAVDALFIAGATDPGQLGALCTAANLKHIFVDLPGKDAPSVITDNFSGAQQLTRKILAEKPRLAAGPRANAYFLGGSISDYATARRVEAFRKTVQEAGGQAGDDQIVQCGYAPRNAAIAVKELCERIGGLPASLFVNSLTAFEGVMSYFVTLSPRAFSQSTIGCFDYDPFAAFLQFPVYMVRQNSNQLIARAYGLLDSGATGPTVVEVEPELVEPRTIVKHSLGELG
jgi:LacI family transcriptional regulator, fructose operon transcriptional repressor